MFNMVLPQQIIDTNHLQKLIGLLPFELHATNVCNALHILNVLTGKAKSYSVECFPDGRRAVCFLCKLDDGEKLELNYSNVEIQYSIGTTRCIVFIYLKSEQFKLFSIARFAIRALPEHIEFNVIEREVFKTLCNENIDLYAMWSFLSETKFISAQLYKYPQVQRVVAKFDVSCLLPSVTLVALRSLCEVSTYTLDKWNILTIDYTF